MTYMGSRPLDAETTEKVRRARVAHGYRDDQPCRACGHPVPLDVPQVIRAGTLRETGVWHMQCEPEGIVG